MYTIATAGHIDHGKSALVKALTGKDPDRLPEERRREMTIELGFASFRLTNGAEVGIIDVPGHERFIKTMIAGVGTLDMVLFTVAADDGWMPQSEEHLAILEYLGQQHGLIVLTKTDLVDPDWIELVKSDIRAKVAGSFLAGVQIIGFSAVDNRNLDGIKAAIESTLGGVERRHLLKSARLFVDRCFTVAGTGTVITGTLREGEISVGQELVHSPSGVGVKVKSLESFYSDLQTAQPGIRLAVGLQSISREAIGRGDLLFYPSSLRSCSILGVKVYPEDRQAHYLRHGREVTFLHGTSEIRGSLVMSQEQLITDDGALVAALRLAAPVVAKAGDRFILRLPTPSLLVGGGVVIDPLLPMFKRNAASRWRLLLAAASMRIEDLILYELEMRMVVMENELLSQSLYPQAEVAAAVKELIAGKRILMRDGRLIPARLWDDVRNSLLASVRQFHQDHPHLEAIPLADLESKTAWPKSLFELVANDLIAQQTLVRFDAGVKLATYSAGLSDDLRQLKEEIVAGLSDRSRPALTRKELLAGHKQSKQVYAYLKQRKEIVEFGGLVLLKDSYDRLVGQVVDVIKRRGRITVAEARDVTGTSRKVVLPLLEEMDRRRITVRRGDYRELST